MTEDKVRFLMERKRSYTIVGDKNRQKYYKGTEWGQIPQAWDSEKAFWR